jgi:hypothetical protein
MLLCSAGLATEATLMSASEKQEIPERIQPELHVEHSG